MVQVLEMIDSDLSNLRGLVYTDSHHQYTVNVATVSAPTFFFFFITLKSRVE